MVGDEARVAVINVEEEDATSLLKNMGKGINYQLINYRSPYRERRLTTAVAIAQIFGNNTCHCGSMYMPLLRDV